MLTRDLLQTGNEQEVWNMGCGPKIGKRRTRKSRRRITDAGSRTSVQNTTLLMPRVPQVCSNCGANIDGRSAKWVGPASIECAYCSTVLPVEFEKIA